MQPAFPPSVSSARTADPSSRKDVSTAAVVAIVAMYAVGYAALAAVAGTFRTPLSPPLPAGAAAPSPVRALASALGLEGTGGELRAVVAILAISMVAAAWILTLRATWRGRLPLIIVVAMTVAVHALVLWLPLLGSRDVYSYTAYGSILSRHGANPYAVAPAAYPHDAVYPYVSVAWRTMPAAYWPLFVRISGLVAGHARTVSGAVDAFRVIASVASLATVAAVAIAARRLAPHRTAFAAAMVGLGPVMVVATVGGGHADAILAMLVACALAMLVVRGRSPRGELVSDLAVTTLLTWATLIKPVAGALLVVHIAAAASRHGADGRRAGGAILHLVVAAAVAAPIAGPFLSRTDPTLGIADAGHAVNAYSPLRLILAAGRAIPGLAAHSDALHAAAAALVIGTAVGLVGLLSWRLWRAQPAPILGEAGAWAWASLVVLLCLPLINPWYLAFVLPLAWLLPKVPRTAVIAAAAVLPVTLAAVQHSRSPAVFEALVWLGRVAVGPALLVLLIWTAREIVRTRGAAIDQLSAGTVATAGLSDQTGAGAAVARRVSADPRRTTAAAMPSARPSPRPSRPGDG